MRLSVFSKKFVLSNKGFRKAALASAVVLGMVASSASFAATDTATTTAIIITPITIANTEDLSFGEFSAGPTSAGTVVLTTAGAASETGGVVLIPTSGAQAAQFTVSGHPDASFSISISDDDLTHTDASTTMAFTPVHDLDGATGDDPASGVLTTGTQTIHVGGTLAVDTAQLAGTYAGTITATVEYN